MPNRPCWNLLSNTKNPSDKRAVAEIDKRHLPAHIYGDNYSLWPGKNTYGYALFCALKNNQMKALILCLYIATTVAWPSSVYLLDALNDQFYNPLTQPHSQRNLDISFRENSYRVAQKFVDRIKCALIIAFDKRWRRVFVTTLGSWQTQQECLFTVETMRSRFICNFHARDVTFS